MSFFSRLACASSRRHFCQSSPDPYLKMILTSRVYDVARESQLTFAANLSSHLDCSIFLKREDLQDVFSFKVRGAYNKMCSLSAKAKLKGIVASSAGNHAQGVALAARKLKINAKICMPIATPEIKISAVRKHGGNYCSIILIGDAYDDAYTEAVRIQHAEGRELIHPFDDPLVIAGQGTVGMEIIRQISGLESGLSESGELEAIFCPVGGGGLIAGVSAFVKQVMPNVKVIGVEASDAAAMTKSLELGKRITLDHVGSFADGAAVKRVGEETFRLAQKYVDEMVTVTTDEICAAIKDGFVDTRSVLEPAGALSIAGLKKYLSTIPELKRRGKRYVAVTSGANMNFPTLRFVAENSEEMEALLCITIPEEPGSFMKLYSVIHPRNITEFSYRNSNGDRAHVIMSFKVSSKEEISEVIEQLSQTGMDSLNLSENEMAKLHGRYLVGGRVQIPNETLYRFEFPERPLALKNFLSRLQRGWNVSLFHYRNHGSDIGHVLAALQVSPNEHAEFKKFLTELNYAFSCEDSNPVYKLFLQ